jgi:uncharacterized protein YecE (DUF72 family)
LSTAQATSIRVGCAGWSLPREHWPGFPEQGTHLQRYASVFPSVEINSSFYRPHRPLTYQRWAASVPADFRFAVKMPKTITHVQRLADCEQLLDDFLFQCSHLGEKLGCILVQLPPSLAYDSAMASVFFAALRERHQGPVVVEPRHESWLGAEALLVQWRISRVAADPSPISLGQSPGGWSGIQYWRLHGSPRIYHSPYERPRLEALAAALLAAAQQGIDSWCIFDNTASGHAVADAMLLQQLLQPAE